MNIAKFFPAILKNLSRLLLLRMYVHTSKCLRKFKSWVKSVDDIKKNYESL